MIFAKKCALDSMELSHRCLTTKPRIITGFSCPYSINRKRWDFEWTEILWSFISCILHCKAVTNNQIVNNEIEIEFSKQKMELNATVEQCQNWREKFDEYFKVCSFFRNQKNTFEFNTSILSFRKNARLHHMGWLSHLVLILWHHFYFCFGR